MLEAVVSEEARATAGSAARIVRLLAATVDVVAEDWDSLAGEPALRSAAASAGLALVSLACDSVPEAIEQALRDLSATVTQLPAP